MTKEIRLKDYKGYKVRKIIGKEITYILNTPEGNIVNTFKSITDLKRFANSYPLVIC